MSLHKQEVTSKELLWILVNLDYKSVDAKNIVYQIEAGSRTEMDQPLTFKPIQVYGICERYPLNTNWTEKIFNSLSTNNSTVTLEHL